MAGGGYSIDSTVTSVVRLLPNGVLDKSFSHRAMGCSGSICASYVYALALQPNGQLLFGGTFQTIDGQVVPNLARLNADGNLDQTFPQSGIYDAVNAITLSSVGDIFVGGYFNQAAVRARRWRVGIALNSAALAFWRISIRAWGTET